LGLALFLRLSKTVNQLPQGVPVAKAKNGKKAAAKKSANKEMLLVGSKVKAAIKDADCNTAGDALDGLNNWVHWLIEQATQRASSNGRKTVRAHDFMV
jgi:histone H3/H4